MNDEIQELIASIFNDLGITFIVDTNYKNKITTRYIDETRHIAMRADVSFIQIYFYYGNNVNYSDSDIIEVELVPGKETIDSIYKICSFCYERIQFRTTGI